MNGLRVEKRKWDGTVSAVDHGARAVAAPPSTIAWFVPRGSERNRPSVPDAAVPHTEHDELWLASTEDWWVLCAQADAERIVALVLHAAAPVEQATGDTLVWIDLDLDFEVHGDDVGLEDEAEFHRHAVTMAYPHETIRGAWQGISELAARYTMEEWPFDGWLDAAIATARDPRGEHRILHTAPLTCSAAAPRSRRPPRDRSPRGSGRGR